jgi:glutathione reductase (NADPH)
MTNDFDVIVIGSGSAARAVAYPCREAGLKVAMADSRPLGGTCALRGCDPKKVLVGAAEVVDRSRGMDGNGVTGAAIDWPRLMTFKRTFTDRFPEKMRKRLDDVGIEVLSGVVSFASPDTLQFGDRLLSAKNIVIVTGAEPAPLNIPGEELAIHSDDFLELAALPGRIVFVGGGYIAFEFAHVTARAGTKTTIVHRGERPLEYFDADLVDKLCDYTREIGVDVRLKSKVTRIERQGGELVVSAEREGVESRIAADAVVHAAGRTPNLKALHLDRGGVAFNAHGVEVNEFLQSTSNARVWAAGDAAATKMPRLTPVSGMQGSVVSHNLLNQQKRSYETGPVPSVAFTIPPLASVGLTETQAHRQGLSFKGRIVDTSQWYSSRRIGETCSAAKVLVDTDTDLIVGAHLLGHGADETINVFTVAMRCRMTASELKKTLFSYPTKTSDIDYLL